MGIKGERKALGQDSFVSYEARQSGVLSLLPAMVKEVRNGIKTTGGQNRKCKVCGRQFQNEYVNRGACQSTKN